MYILIGQGIPFSIVQHNFNNHPLAEIVQIASQFKSEILLEYDKYKINAKSIMGIIAFNPSEGMNVIISANGKDEDDAIEALERFFICE